MEIIMGIVMIWASIAWFALSVGMTKESFKNDWAICLVFVSLAPVSIMIFYMGVYLMMYGVP